MAYRRTDEIIAKLGENRRAILNAAHALVAEGGFAAAQMTEVAKRAEVATGTLYRYFPSKEYLCRQVFREVSARELKLLSAAASGPGSALQRMEAALQLFATRAARGQRMAHSLLAEAVGTALEEERRSFRNGQTEIFASLLQEGIENGTFRAANAQIAAACLTGAIAAALVDSHATKPDNGKALEEVLRFCRTAIGIPAG
jgi:AcrR family transcriptional regulator